MLLIYEKLVKTNVEKSGAIYNNLTLIWVGFLGVRFEVGGVKGVKLLPS